MEKMYLGDGVYARYDGFQIVLETSDGIQVTNTIYLDPETADNLIKYIEKVRSV